MIIKAQSVLRKVVLCGMVLATSASFASTTGATSADAVTKKNAAIAEFYRRLEMVKQPNYKPKEINLAWSVPSTRVSGTPIAGSDISGYDLSYIGRTSGKSGVVHIPVGSRTNYKFSWLAPDTYDFAISAYDTKGIASPMSNVVTITVQ